MDKNLLFKETTLVYSFFFLIIFNFFVFLKFVFFKNNQSSLQVQALHSFIITFLTFISFIFIFVLRANLVKYHLSILNTLLGNGLILIFQTLFFYLISYIILKYLNFEVIKHFQLLIFSGLIWSIWTSYVFYIFLAHQ